MVWLKECPRCQGDLFLEQDSYGKFKTCVQCGYEKDLVGPGGDDASLSTSATGTDPNSFKAFLAMMVGD